MPEHASSDPLLDELIIKYGSDKSLSAYNLGYANIFKEIRHNIKSVLEIGVGSLVSNNSCFAGIKQYYPHYTPGGSLRAWRDYFPNAFIHGVDIGEDCLLEEDRIKTFIFSSSSLEGCRKNLFNFKYDVIIDDGCHNAMTQLLTFKNLAPLVNDGGFYFIEDLGGGPEQFEEPDGSYFKIELFRDFHAEMHKTAEKYGMKIDLNSRPLTISKKQ